MIANEIETEYIINTKEFAEKMKNARSENEVLAAFRNNGIEIIAEELVEIANSPPSNIAIKSKSICHNRGRWTWIFYFM